MTQSSWLTSFKERQAKADVDDVERIAAESLADVVSGNVEEVKNEELEELVWKSRLLCSSPSSQLARQLHSEKRVKTAVFLPIFLITLFCVYKS